MVFTLMLRIDTNKMKDRCRKFWAMVADAVLPAYLVLYYRCFSVYRMV